MTPTRRPHPHAPGSPSRPVVAASFPGAAPTGWSPAPAPHPGIADTRTAEATA